MNRQTWTCGRLSGMLYVVIQFGVAQGGTHYTSYSKSLHS
jgi:hypothetical protein